MPAKEVFPKSILKGKGQIICEKVKVHKWNIGRWTEMRSKWPVVWHERLTTSIYCSAQTDMSYQSQRYQEHVPEDLRGAVASFPIQVFHIIFVNANKVSANMLRNVNLDAAWANYAVSACQMETNRSREFWEWKSTEVSPHRWMPSYCKL